MEQKVTLRRELKKMRNALSLEQMQFCDGKIRERLFSLKEFIAAKVIFCYISFGSEVDTAEIINKCLLKKKSVCVPKIQEGVMQAVKIDSMSNLLKTAYGYLEPSSGQIIKSEKIDLAIVPALAFNKEGYRVGYGGGYYDRFLDGFFGTSIGIIRDEFILDKIPLEPQDRRVDIIISQSGQKG